MHELSLAGGVLQLVEEQAQRHGFSRVRVLRLEAGQLAGVDVAALRFALESVAPGTLLEGTRCEISEPPGQATCLDCGACVTVSQRGEPCSACGAYRLQHTAGTALRVIDMEVSDDGDPPGGPCART